MSKKTITVFIFVLLLFCMNKVQALTMEDIVYPKTDFLDMMIETNIDGIWDTITTEKNYTTGDQSDLLLYKITNSSKNGNQIRIKQKEERPEVIGVIRNGYNKKTSSAYGITGENSEDDFYVATRIAVTCAYEGHDVDGYYRIIDALPRNTKPRANAIIEAAKALLQDGKEFAKNAESESIELMPLEISDDNIFEAYQVEMKGAEFDYYTVQISSDDMADFSVINNDTGEKQNVFKNGEECFSIMIPKEESEEPFNLKISVDVFYNADRIFLGNTAQNNYIIYSEQAESVHLTDNIDNRKSSFILNFADEENIIQNSLAQINGVDYSIDETKQILVDKLGKERVSIKLPSLPDGYYYASEGEVIEETYNVDIGYNENLIQDIEVKKKQIIDDKEDDNDGNIENPDKTEDEGEINKKPNGDGEVGGSDANNNSSNETGTDKEAISGSGTNQEEISQGGSNTEQVKPPKPESSGTNTDKNNSEDTEHQKPKPGESQDNATENAEDNQNKNEGSSVDKNEEIKKEPSENMEDKVGDETKVENPEKTGNYTKESSNIKEEWQEIEQSKTLPKTGQDYFILKLILINVVALIIILIRLEYLGEFKCTKKTDC